MKEFPIWVHPLIKMTLHIRLHKNQLVVVDSKFWHGKELQIQAPEKILLKIGTLVYLQQLKRHKTMVYF